MNRGNVSSDIFAVVTPLGFISLGIFWRQINQVMSSDSGQLQPCREALTQLEILQCLYEGHQGEQEELYQVAYQMLQRIVRNSKRKRELLKYTKNLAVPPTAILSPFPESLRKEKKVETQTGVFKPKVPAAATKKKSDIEVKPSKHHKGVTTVEPVSDRVPEKSYPATSSSTSDDNTSPPETAVLEASLIVDSSERFLPKPEKIPVVDLSSAKQLPGKSFPYAFDRRVERWHQHPFGQPLPPADFPEYCDTDHAYQELMHVYHALHPFVDRFLSMGIQGTWINSQRQKEDIRIVIVAEVTYKGKKKRGFIVYTIDRTTQVCYHKFFSEKINQDLMCQVINRTFDENDFPELQKAVLADRRKALTPVRALKGTVKIDPIFDFVEIEDKTQELHIRLFKAHDD